jgi:hypothetical protein
VAGTGAGAQPVTPAFTPQEADHGFFTPAIGRLIAALESGGEAVCSGHDYRQALEIAIALKVSAHGGHRRIALPLADRHQRLYPHPYRLHGGDVSGWGGGGYQGPPQVV